MKTTSHPPGQVRLLTLAILLAFAPSARAQPQDLTTVPLEKLLEMRVIAASSYEQSTTQAPSAVSIVTAEDIRRYGYKTLAQALQSVPGLFVTNDLSYEYLGLRGFNRVGDYNSRFQLSVNGLRTNDALFDAAYIGNEFPLDMALIERIEFAPGPGSSIYGSNAMLGVINVVTKTGAQLAGPRVAASVGSDGHRELAASYGRRFASGLEILTSVSGLRADGQEFYFPGFDAPETNNGIATGQNRESFQRAYFRATYEGFDFEAFGGKRVKRTPSVYADSNFLSGNNRVGDRLGFAVLRYGREIAPATRFEARVSTGIYEYFGIYPAGDGSENRDDALGRWNGAEVRVVSTAFDRHKIVAGAEVQDDVRLDQRNADPSAVYLDRHDSGRRFGAYVQDEFRVADGWLLNAGVRYDRYTSYGNSVNPRFALLGEIAEGTTLKLLYGSAFRAPNAYELYYQSESFVANTVLGPERSRSVEAVLERQRGDSFRWRASVFQYRFSGLIDQVDEDGEYVYRNQGSVTGRGAELSAMAVLPADIRLRVSASGHALRDADGRRTTNAPRYTAKLGADAPLPWAGLRAAVDLVAVGERLDLSRQSVPASFTANLVVSTRERWMGAQFTAGIYNVFDKRNSSPVSEYFRQSQNPGLGRTFRIDAEWRF